MEKPDATAERLVNEINLGTPGSADRLDDPLKSIMDACGPIRDERNKLIAHLDLATVQVKRVPRTSHAQVDRAICALRNFTNAAAGLLGEGPIAFGLVSPPGDGGDLITLLRMAERYHASARNGEDSIG